MPDYYEYEEEYSHRRRDDPSPDFHSGGVSPHPSRDRIHLDPPPRDQSRPRSVPPPNTSLVVRRRSSRSRSRAPSTSSSSSTSSGRHRDGRSRSRHNNNNNNNNNNRSPSPISRARSVVDSNFTNTPAGIGAGLLGAVVGGLVAREASGAATRHRHKERGYYDQRDPESENRTRLVSTILGAVAGGLGANALTNRVEDSRARDRVRQQEWERRYGRESDLPHYDTGRPADLDHRNGRGLPPPDSDEEEYDFVYDDPRYDDRRPSRRRSEESNRYRP